MVCSAFLVLDGLSQREIIPRKFFTRTLLAKMEDSLPSIVHRGQPGTTRYFRADGQFPVYYYKFDEDGILKENGQMTLEQAQLDGALNGGLQLRSLPHIGNVPTDYMRSIMLRYWLAVIFGIAGGLLSYIVRGRAMSLTASADVAS